MSDDEKILFDLLSRCSVLLTLYVPTSSYKSCKKCTGKGIARPTTEETREVMIAELDITVNPIQRKCKALKR